MTSMRFSTLAAYLYSIRKSCIETMDNDFPVVAGGVLSADLWIGAEAFIITLHAVSFPSRV
jgi:hypothetical protein